MDRITLSNLEALTANINRALNRPVAPWMKEVEANARRIVAAVNACEGIPTSRLEAGSVDILAFSQELHAERDRLRAEVASLLADKSALQDALNDAVGWMIANPSERKGEEAARIETLERCGKAQRAALGRGE